MSNQVVQDAIAIRHAIGLLKGARAKLAAGGAGQAERKTRGAIKSAEGALREAERQIGEALTQEAAHGA